MPIYEFQCSLCGGIFEWIQKVNDSYPSCVICNWVEVRKLISAPGKIKNFEAYYETDIDDKPTLVRNPQGLKDAIAKHNDGELASKVGKLATYD